MPVPDAAIRDLWVCQGVMERVLVEGYDLTNTQVSGGTGCVSGTGTVCGWFLGITLWWGNGYYLFLG